MNLLKLSWHQRP